METLQRIVFPNLQVAGHEALYVRLNDRAFCELARPRVRFLEGGEVTTDTFYSGLTIPLWKRTSPVNSLHVELEGHGEFLLGFGVHRLGYASQWLSEQPISLAAGEPVALPVSDWPQLQDGLLFLRLRALSPGWLDSGRFATSTPPPNDVRLGLIITHFNRQNQVRAAVERIRRDVLQSPGARRRISLTVIDNSNNLAISDDDGITCIPNRNLGGSGGFARGLLAITDREEATHALFMDDDASCEAEGILRAFALLRYASSPRLAIAGALLSESEPWHLLEKGACFDGKCRPLHAGKDMRQVHELLWCERQQSPPGYGGWWFFAFPLRALRQYPFPFFVRGDDVFFSLGNQFDITTANGIACLGEEFRVKHGPLTAYLDGRYHLMHLVLRPRQQAKMLRRLVNNQFLKPLFGYHYASARAFTLAVRHVTEGPAFFRNHMDLADVRAQIAAWQPAEKLQPIRDLPLKPKNVRAGRENPARALLRLFTLQGFLLPRALLRKRVLVHDKTFYGRASDTFRFQAVLYEHWPSNTGYVARFDRRLFFREIGSLLTALYGFLRRLPQLRLEYSEALPRLTSAAFWRAVYGLSRPTGAVTISVKQSSAMADAPAVPRAAAKSVEQART
jgi:hypothetical protein